MALSVYFKKLTVVAALNGVLCALLVYAGAGFTGIALMTTFFITGTLATSWKVDLKRSLKVAEENKGQRKTSQVLANAGVAAIAGLMSLIFETGQTLWPVLIAAAFSAATADTLASELGTVYGKRFCNILTFKPDLRGLDGVISIEGTLIGLMGSALIAYIYAIGFSFNTSFIIVVISGTMGNLTDSFLGAWLERKGIIKNDAVNFLNTLFAAASAALMWYL
ncbi:DUF92 domain-containing protein [Mucilaginibacter terrae]|nr:DUF92 domain-containing protein [Mucilaginibacter terrae]